MTAKSSGSDSDESSEHAAAVDFHGRRFCPGLRGFTLKWREKYARFLNWSEA